MAFQQRAENADSFAAQVYADIASMGFQTSINGVEVKHPEFARVSKRSTDPTSLSIRFAPDAIGWFMGKRDTRAFYVDAKAGFRIERLAWENYQRLSDNGYVVVLIFKVMTTWSWNIQSCIKLASAEATVSRFPIRFPIVDGWITPRLSTYWNNQIRQTNQHASGTPYREVDVSSLHAKSLFKPEILNILANQPTLADPY